MSLQRVAKVERLFYILTYLNNHHFVTASELAKHCGTSVRSIYRDMRTLEEQGVQYISEGRKGYRLISRPIRTGGKLTESEWMALTLFPLLSQGITSSEHPFHYSYRSGLEKVSSFVQKNSDLTSIGAGLGERIRLHDRPKEPRQFTIMPTIIDAILGNYTMEVHYYSLYRNEDTVRKIDPYYLVPREGHLYVIAYCHFRKEIRVFKLSRFKEIKRTSSTFRIPKNFNIDEYLKNRWTIMDEGEDTTFTVKFNESIARYIDEQDFHVNTTIENNNDGSILLTTTVKSVKEFLSWIRSFGLNAEVLEPKEIREKLLEEYRKMVERYSQ